MNLLIDLGNTRLKWALVDAHGEFIAHDALAHSQLAEELNEQWQVLVDREIESVWLCSVAHIELVSPLEILSDELFGLPINIVKVVDQAAGLTNGYADLAKLGVDRWVAAIGARQIFPQGDVIIIDAGTAVTIDWLSASNQYVGGAILPGFTLMHDALVDKAQGIDSSLSKVSSVVGKNTVQCVNAGVQYGLAGGVRRVVDEMRSLQGKSSSDQGEARILLCGGSAEVLFELLDFHVQLEPQVVMLGLAKLAQARIAKECG